MAAYARTARFSASFILDMVYGYEVADGEDQMVQAVLGAAAELPTLVAPKAFVVDALPFCAFHGLSSGHCN